MKAGRPNLLRRIFLLVIVITVIAAVLLLRPDNRGAKLVAETRQALRQQGFKTDLADFDFSTSAELRDREAVLQGLERISLTHLREIDPNLMEAVNNNSAIVVWKGDSVKMAAQWRNPSSQLTWDEFRQQLNEHKAVIDSACEAILSGPIRFSAIATNGNAMRLPHLALLRSLTDVLCNRALLELHDGNKDAAWTNVMAATRLVTAWNPEPVEISYLVRFVVAKEAFNISWQALQSHDWSDAQLARLQQEWEDVDFITNLTEIAVYKLASDADQSARYREMMLKDRPSLLKFAIQSLQAPSKYIWANMRARRRESDYLHNGWYEDQKDLMLYNRDWEVQLRNAVCSPTWAQMRRLPAVTNQVPFQSKFPSTLMQVYMNMRQPPAAISERGGGLLGRAAEAEAERRILLA